MDDIKTIGQIMQEYEQKMRDPEFVKQQVRREQSFRRGYHHGWDNAIDEIFELWRNGVSREDAYAMCARYVNGVAEWRTEARQGMDYPPTFPRR